MWPICPSLIKFKDSIFIITYNKEYTDKHNLILANASQFYSAEWAICLLMG